MCVNGTLRGDKELFGQKRSCKFVKLILRALMDFTVFALIWRQHIRTTSETCALSIPRMTLIQIERD